MELMGGGYHSPLIDADLETARRVALARLNQTRQEAGLRPVKKVPRAVVEEYLSPLPPEEISRKVGVLLARVRGRFSVEGHTFYVQAIPEIHEPVSSEETNDHKVLVVGANMARQAIIFHDKRPKGSEGWLGDCIVYSRYDRNGLIYRIMDNRLAVARTEELVSNVLV
ncbi:MAG: hypothetical protein US80_C0003G0056 [Candidatus Daviesbacteria bacterium GW2011_GWA2_38_17]|uniref:Uncharacterized protein n=1 Tax=Candidatus Daviesbacteria bacterium GW2011_GWF2_38_6 TaxID=1618432 RepID=A0A0G0NLY4_9BACT|nr:MAG: hypothetical protein US80_C0003G0056 [Candidatus Daviesbacteria bacterium GW2011_GWA2_38_17]KKQ78086.1 MAG: hypothetical protein US99_C0030G0002 [Candidatus Daviesbacteria bacterium GW2011_GWF2_38_6]